MDEETFKWRTKALGLGVIRLVEALPRRKTGEVIGRQLLRSATSVGANYRAACRARSVADVCSKLAIVEEEADETIYWLELLTESGLVAPPAATPLKAEANEIVAMTVASIKTLRERSSDQNGKHGSPGPQSKIQNPKSNI